MNIFQKIQKLIVLLQDESVLNRTHVRSQLDDVLREGKSPFEIVYLGTDEYPNIVLSDTDAGGLISEMFDYTEAHVCYEERIYDEEVIGLILQLASEDLFIKCRSNISKAIYIYRYSVDEWENYDITDMIRFNTCVESRYKVMEIVQFAILLSYNELDRYSLFRYEIQEYCDEYLRFYKEISNL